MKRFFLPDGYRENLSPEYFTDDTDVDWQPEVYRMAGAFAASRGCDTIIDVGCGKARKSLALPLRVVGIDHGANLPSPKAEADALAMFVRPHPDAWFIERDLENGFIPLDPHDGASLGISIELSEAVVVCADVIEHLIDPMPLLHDLALVASFVQALLISTPDRDLVRGPDDLGPPANACHVREWSKHEFAELLGSVGIQAEITHTIDNDRAQNATTLLAVALKAS